MKRVVIIQEHLPHYRRRFFEELREALRREEVELEVVFGTPSLERFVVDPPSWAIPVDLIRLGRIVWHRAYAICKGADLVILPQEVKYLMLYVQLARRLFGGGKVAFWGHGKNFQARQPDCYAERLKRRLSRKVDWWFAYNDLSARIVRSLGYPPEKIVSVGNTIDVDGLLRRREAVSPEELERLREDLGLRSGRVGIFTGGLHSDKRIEFLFEAAHRIRRKIPDFELIVIGDGEKSGLVEQAANEHGWVHFLGKLGDEDKVPYWALADVLLMPGLVGLVVVDSFALGVPMVTTDYPYHSPEIDYLHDGVNGLIVGNWESVEAYADAVIALLEDSGRLEALRNGALSSLKRHSMENMVNQMRDGIVSALDSSVMDESGRV